MEFNNSVTVEYKELKHAYWVDFFVSVTHLRVQIESSFAEESQLYNVKWATFIKLLSFFLIIRPYQI